MLWWNKGNERGSPSGEQFYEDFSPVQLVVCYQFCGHNALRCIASILKRKRGKLISVLFRKACGIHVFYSVLWMIG